MRAKVLTLAIILATALCAAAVAQDAPPESAAGQERPAGGRGMGMDFAGVGGQITAIEGSTITLQTFRGDTATVRITPSTRFVKDRQEAKLSDFKVGDRVLAAGAQDKDGVWVAQTLRERGGEGGFARGGMTVKPEDNGKTYIFGVITKIDGTKLTVKKPDDTEQVIQVDDDTSFRNGRESVTLADVKPGDFVRGRGEIKNGIFVPKVLNAGRGRGPRQEAPLPPDAAPQNQSQPAPDSNGPTK